MFDYISMHGILAYCLFLAMMLQLYMAEDNAGISNLLKCVIIAAALSNLLVFTLTQLDIAERLYAVEQQHVHSSAH